MGTLSMRENKVLIYLILFGEGKEGRGVG